MKNSNSRKDHLSWEDWKLWAINAILWLDVPVGIYFGQILTIWTLADKVWFGWDVFAPNLATITSIATWFGMQMKGLRDRYKSGASGEDSKP